MIEVDRVCDQASLSASCTLAYYEICLLVREAGRSINYVGIVIVPGTMLVSLSYLPLRDKTTKGKGR